MVFGFLGFRVGFRVQSVECIRGFTKIRDP